LPGLQARRDLSSGVEHDREVGLALWGERRRESDQDRVGVAQVVVVARRLQTTGVDKLSHRLRGHVVDIALAAVEHLHTLGHRLDEQDRVACLAEDLGKRHADVAGADDGDCLAQSALSV
jgi:hypothetical protein